MDKTQTTETPGAIQTEHPPPPGPRAASHAYPGQPQYVDPNAAGPSEAHHYPEQTQYTAAGTAPTGPSELDVPQYTQAASAAPTAAPQHSQPAAVAPGHTEASENTHSPPPDYTPPTTEVPPEKAARSDQSTPPPYAPSSSAVPPEKAPYPEEHAAPPTYAPSSSAAPPEKPHAEHSTPLTIQSRSENEIPPQEQIHPAHPNPLAVHPVDDEVPPAKPSPPSSSRFTEGIPTSLPPPPTGPPPGASQTHQELPPFPKYNPADYEDPPPKPPRPTAAAQHRPLSPTSETVYIRDPHKLTAYLVPFPEPTLKKGLFHSASGGKVPTRFLIYTPPPPPLSAPAEGEKEARLHKLQRKWQNEVREAKTSDAKVASWKGLKGRATKGIDWAMNQTTSSHIDFVNRVGTSTKSKSRDPSPNPTDDKHSNDGYVEGDTTKKTVGLEEMVLVYPAQLPGTEEEIRAEFVNNMLRTKSKAQRDAIIATGLLPVAFAVDLLATLVWPFGGLVEIDAVWAAASIRGAKTARSVTKRLSSTDSPTKDDTNPNDGPKLKMSFMPSPRIEVLKRYLDEECHKRDPKYFKSAGVPPGETEVLEAMGWSPSGEGKNWEDEQWEIREVKDDLKATMHKGAREWDKWVKTFEKDPQKAMKQ